MNKFQVNLTVHAIADLRGMSKEIRGQIHRDLKTLESAPYPIGASIKRLKGFTPPVYRLRSGDFRVLYHIQRNNVTILRVIDRKILKRTIQKLKI